MGDPEHLATAAEIIAEAHAFLFICRDYEPGDPENWDALRHACAIIRRLLALRTLEVPES